ncbi:hypothetical protein AB5N19_13134 [Seiridium cardinale]
MAGFFLFHSSAGSAFQHPDFMFNRDMLEDFGDLVTRRLPLWVEDGWNDAQVIIYGLDKLFEFLLKHAEEEKDDFGFWAKVCQDWLECSGPSASRIRHVMKLVTCCRRARVDRRVEYFKDQGVDHVALSSFGTRVDAWIGLAGHALNAELRWLRDENLATNASSKNALTDCNSSTADGNVPLVMGLSSLSIRGTARNIVSTDPITLTPTPLLEEKIKNLKQERRNLQREVVRLSKEISKRKKRAEA